MNGESGSSALADVLDVVGVAAGILGPDLRLVAFNDRFRLARGYPANVCDIGAHFSDLLRHDAVLCGMSEEVETFIQSWLRRATQRLHFAEEQTLIDGRIMEVRIAPIEGGCVALAACDITERAEELHRIRHDQEWYDLAAEASSEGLYDWDISANTLRVTYRLTGMLGLDPGALRSEDWAALVHPDDETRYRDALTGHFRGETPLLDIEYRIRRKSGDYIWFADRGKCVRNSAGRAERLVGAVTDITGRKLTEASLRLSEERYELAMAAVDEGVYDWDIDKDEIYYSPGVRTALGLDPEQLKTPQDWFERLHPDDSPRYRGALIDHFKGLTDRFECELRYRRGDGIWRYACQHGVAQFDASGRAVRMVGATGDVTELVEHRAEAERAWALLEKALESISDGFAVYDAEDRLVLCNAAYRDLYPGVEDVLEVGAEYAIVLRALAQRRILTDIGDDVEGWVRDRLDRRARAAGSYQNQLADGRWVNVAWRRARDGGLVGVFTDISALKQAEIRLRESEQRYTLAMESANEGLWDWDVARGVMFVAPRLAMQLGLRLDRDGRMPVDEWTRRIHPEDVALYRGAIRGHLKGETAFYSVEFRARDAAGDYVWLFHRGLGQRDRSGRVTRMTGSTADISARKAAERRLHESEERYALATAAASEGIYDWDVMRDELVVSEQLNRIMSLRKGRLNSIEWNERVHPRDRDRYRAAIVAHFKGETAYLACEYRVRTGDGGHVWISDNASSVRDEAGRAVRLVGAIADISERKQAEQALREAKQRADDASEIATEKAEALEVLSAKLSKYLSPQVYSSIFAGRQEVAVDAKRKKLTVFFSDIAGFTSVVDTLESEEVTSMLNDYLSAMSSIAIRHGATIDKFIGDAILAFFGDPESKGSKQDAIACVRMAIEMQRRLKRMQETWRSLGLEEIFELRIGITTGFCTVGNFGSDDRMDYTVVGSEVNAAARLQAQADNGGILISGETHALVRDTIHAEDIGMVTLKGLSRPVHAYRVLGTYAELEQNGDLIHVDQPGLRLLFSESELTPEVRERARAILKQALSRLERD